MNLTRPAQRQTAWLAAGLAILIGAHLTDREVNGKGESDEAALRAGAAMLQEIPRQIGHWKSTDEEISSYDLTRASYPHILCECANAC